MQLSSPAPTSPSAPVSSPVSPVIANPIVGILSTPNRSWVIRDRGPLGPAAGYGSVEEAVQGLASLTRGQASSAAIVQRDGRFHGMEMGRTQAELIPSGYLEEPPDGYGLREDLFGTPPMSLNLFAPGIVGVVDGGFNEAARFNSGVRFLGTSLTLTSEQAAPLGANYHDHNAGRLVDLTQLDD